MRNSSGSTGLALVVVVACVACGDRAATHSTADRDVIATVMQDYAKALEGGDPATALSFWTDDPLYINNGIPTLRGRAALDSVFRGIHSAWRDVQASIDPEEITVAGAFAYVIGTYWETFTLTEGTTQQLQGRSLTGTAPQRVQGRFLFIMSRQADGAWKIARAIGADLPPPPDLSRPQN